MHAAQAQRHALLGCFGWQASAQIPPIAWVNFFVAATRLTCAEGLMGQHRVLMLDEINTGLDSATLHSVVRFLALVSVRGAG